MRQATLFVWTAIVVCTFLACGGSDGSQEPDSGPGATDGARAFCETFDVAAELVTDCTSSACHDDDRPAADIDLLSANLKTRLANVQSNTPLCDGEVLVDVDEPSNSLLFTKLTDTPPCGGPMPSGGSPWSAQEMACVEQWLGEP